MTTSSKMCVDAVFTRPINWETINWAYHEAVVKKLQVRIAKAMQSGKQRSVKALQWLLTHSLSAKLMAVRKVTQNKGNRTPGVDGIILSKPEQKVALVKDLSRRNYKPMPLRRIYIPKSNGKKRPLGIPTMKDRAMQALHAIALIPIAEATADEDSYGFRPERSTADAIEQLFVVLARKSSPQWILEGDIKGCFDHISHQWMLDNICTDQQVLKKWLKAGFIETRKLFPTEEGTPQGGIISPTLCNMVLDGLEELLKKTFITKQGIHYVRYADDFVVTGRSKDLLENEIRSLIANFLKERGLELSNEKTKVTQITEGFDFLGQNIRKYACGKDRYKLLIKPSKKNVQTFLDGIRQVFREAGSMDQAALIRTLNPKIRGWANYHRSVVAKATFSKIYHIIWRETWRWAKRRHANKGNRWIHRKYYGRIQLRNNCFTGLETQKDGTRRRIILVNMADTPIRRHTKIKKKAHPYDSRYDEYFETRTSDKWRKNNKRSLAKYQIELQKGLCPCCGDKITIGQKWYIHLLARASQGGDYTMGNICIVHPSCHKAGFEKGFVFALPVTSIKM
jgi:RNA-directed DNA polymerase